MTQPPRPTPEDLRLLDPGGSFVDRLAADRETIAALGIANPAALQVVVHRLAGAAGTFGFTEIGAIAIEIDDRFADGQPVTEADITRLLAALNRAMELIS